MWLFTGTGGGSFNPGVLAIPLSGGARNLAAVDFNGDGNLDLAVTCCGGIFAVVLGNGNGTFQSPRTFSQLQNVVPVAAGVLTKGGHPGIAVRGTGAQGNSVYLYYGNGVGGFSGPHYVNLPGTGGVGIAIGDVNGDGIPDLVSSGGYIAFGTARGVFKPPVYYPVVSSGSNYNLVLADLRNNGLTDIVTDWNLGNSVLLNQGKGVYEDGEWTAVAGGAGCGAAADYNGDGKPDIAVNTATGISILLGTGKAKSPFTAGATIALEGAGCLVTGDLNGDGIPDLLVPVNDTVVAYLGKGDGTFTLAIYRHAVRRLCRNDGKLDFATSGNLLALGNGDGTFQTPEPFVFSTPSGGFSNIAVGDINNDGWPDVVLTNVNVPYSNVYVLFNNQQGGFTQVPAPSSTNLTTQAVLTGLNGAGNLDLVLTYLDGDVSIFLGNGTGEFTFTTAFAIPVGGPTLAVVADLNGDGVPDIAVLQPDTIGIFLGTGNATFNATTFCIGTGPSPGDLLTENLHGQRPSRGLPDIVVPDTSGGVMVLTNEGTTGASSAAPYCYPPVIAGPISK